MKPLSIPSTAPSFVNVNIGFNAESGADWDTVRMVLGAALSNGRFRWNFRITVKPGAQVIDRTAEGATVRYLYGTDTVFDAHIGDELAVQDEDDNTGEPDKVRAEFLLTDDDMGEAVGIARWVRYSDLVEISVY